MKSYFSRFSHITLSCTGIREVFTSSLSHSDLIGVSRSNKFAALSNLDYRVKPDNDNIGVDHRVKFENDSLCAGRSMVEMLGVLAIIGVLSVGAIAGYSKAMMKYKLNKYSEQMNTVINAIARNVHSFDNIYSQNGSATSLTTYFVKMGEIPKEMVKSNNSYYVYDIFSMRWAIAMSSDSKSILLSSYNTPSTKSADELERCRTFITLAKENSDSIHHLATISGHGTSSAKFALIYGDNFCTPDRKCLKNVTLDNIYEICTAQAGATSAVETAIWWKIRD